MSQPIYISRNGQTEGPYTEEAVRSGLADGTILDTDYACREGMTEWVTVAALLAPSASDAPTPPLVETASSASRVTSLELQATSLGKLPSQVFEETWRISPDSRHFACAVQEGRKQYVLLDGQPQARYAGIGIGVGLRFSPDSQRLAYAVAEKKNFLSNALEWRVALDGQAQKLSTEGIARGSLTFSPDSRRFAYAAAFKGGLAVVVDGQPQAAYESVAPPSITFDASGRRLAYAAFREDRWIVVADGSESRPYSGCAAICFSPDTKRLAYGGEDERGKFVVVDGQEGDRYEDVAYDQTLCFSPCSRSVAYVARRNDQWHVIVDGRQVSRSEAIGERFFLFSPDGRRLAYDAREGNRIRVVIYDLGSDRADARAVVDASHFVFAPDGSRYSYIAAGADGGLFVVVDGVDQPAYQGIGRGLQHVTLKFSPDGKRLGYAAQRGGRWFLVVDGVEGKPYEHIEDIVWNFSPDSRHVAYGAMQDGRALVVVDDVESAPCKAFVGDALLWDDPQSMHTLVKQGDEIVRWELRASVA